MENRVWVSAGGTPARFGTPALFVWVMQARNAGMGLSLKDRPALQASVLSQISTHGNFDERLAASWRRLTGVLALVSYAAVWVRLFLPFSYPGRPLLVYGLINLVTLALFGSFGFLVGKGRQRPWVGFGIGIATGLLMLALPAFFLCRGLAAIGAALPH